MFAKTTPLSLPPPPTTLHNNTLTEFVSRYYQLQRKLIKMEEDWQQEGEEQEDQADDLEDGDEEEDDILDMGEDVATNDKDALLMRFCPHDSSMLYPQVSTVLR
jgi:hypothetical protein